MVTAQAYLGDVLEISQMSVGFSSTKVGGYGHLFLWLLTTGLSQSLLMWVSLPGPSNMVTDFYWHKKENNSQYIREKLPSLCQSNVRDKPLFLHSGWPRWVPSSAHIQRKGLTWGQEYQAAGFPGCVLWIPVEAREHLSVISQMSDPMMPYTCSKMAEGHLLLTQWHFLGKAEQTQKPGWDGLREKKNKCPWVLMWWGFPRALGLDSLSFPPAPGMEAWGFVILLLWNETEVGGGDMHGGDAGTK